MCVCAYDGGPFVAVVAAVPFVVALTMVVVVVETTYALRFLCW